jgi:hypothetical protein
MTRTQIQLPDAVYLRAKQLADAREISMAELVRRSLELLLSQYPAPDQTIEDWQFPAPRKLGWRGLSHAQIKEIAQESNLEEQMERLPKKRKRA